MTYGLKNKQKSQNFKNMNDNKPVNLLIKYYILCGPGLSASISKLFSCTVCSVWLNHFSSMAIFGFIEQQKVLVYTKKNLQIR